MTEAIPETQPKRRQRTKGNSLHVMKELTGLMAQRTAILAQISVRRLELAQLEASLQQLGSEIQWRAGIFGLTSKDASGPQHAFPNPMQTAGSPVLLETPIFRQPEPPQMHSGINRGMADLASITR